MAVACDQAADVRPLSVSVTPGHVGGVIIVVDSVLGGCVEATSVGLPGEDARLTNENTLVLAPTNETECLWYENIKFCKLVHNNPFFN